MFDVLFYHNNINAAVMQHAKFNFDTLESGSCNVEGIFYAAKEDHFSNDEHLQ